MWMWFSSQRVEDSSKCLCHPCGLLAQFRDSIRKTCFKGSTCSGSNLCLERSPFVPRDCGPFSSESEWVHVQTLLNVFFFLNLLTGRKSVVWCLSKMPCDLRFLATLFHLGVLGWVVICLKRNFPFHFISVAFSRSPETKNSREWPVRKLESRFKNPIKVGRRTDFRALLLKISLITFWSAF